MEKIKRIFSLALCLVLVVLMLPAPTANARPSQAEVDEKIRWIIASIPDSCDTDYEKALWLHDYLCKTVVYEYDLDEYSYTALINGEADCGGYAAAYAELLREKDERIKDLKDEHEKLRKEKKGIGFALACIVGFVIILLTIDILNGNFGYFRY